MNMDQLETFLAVVKFRNFSIAAEKLNVTQPTVSTRIQNLENELDCELFKREGRYFSLTVEGEQFQSYATKITSQLFVAKEAISLIKKPRLKMGFIPSLSTILISNALSLIDYKELYVSIRKGADSEELIDLVLEDKLDVAFVIGTIDHKELHSDEITNKMHLVFIVSQDHQLANKTRIDKELFKGETLICYRRDTQLWLDIEEKLAGIQLNRIEAFDVETVKTLVKHGKGFTILPSVCIDGDQDGLRIEYFAELNLNQLKVIYKKKFANIKKIEPFIESIKNQLLHNLKF